MPNRRKFIQLSILGMPLAASAKSLLKNPSASAAAKPLIISTWTDGIKSNAAGWKILKEKGRALDAVEEAAKIAENDKTSCCVGLDANPDRDGKVTLDACIMDEKGDCGGVAFVQNFRHPVSIARKVMEKTPHVFLVGEGAEQFAAENGFERLNNKLSPRAEKEYQKWLKQSKYKPVVNIENFREQGNLSPKMPTVFENGDFNHDTIGILSIDAQNNLSGSCTTSGMAFKMHGRVGDSPIIGAGLFVDNEVGAAVATGVGEEVIRICGSHLIVELMRMGKSPQAACEEAISRIVKRNPAKMKEIQVAFLAISKGGAIGAFAIQPGFTYALTNDEVNKVYDAKSYF